MPHWASQMDMYAVYPELARQDLSQHLYQNGGSVRVVTMIINGISIIFILVVVVHAIMLMMQKQLSVRQAALWKWTSWPVALTVKCLLPQRALMLLLVWY